MRGRAEGFYAALAALLFTAACAWLGAALYAALGQEGAPGAEEPYPHGRLRGILLRRETTLAEAIPGAVEGERLSAAETGMGSGLYFSDTDGFEALGPETALPFSAARLEALLDAAPEAHAGVRLVTGRAVSCAAFVEGGGSFRRGDRVRVLFDGAERPYPAQIEAVDENAVLLRFTEGLEYLCRARFVEGEIEAP